MGEDLLMRDFLFSIRPESEESPVQQRVSLIALYAIAFASSLAVPYNLVIDYRRGDISSVFILGAYGAFIVSGLAVFFSTRSVRKSRLLFAIGICVLAVRLIWEGGGERGFGLLYFIPAFPLFYFVLGHRGGLAFSALFLAGVGARFAFGPFPPESFLADAENRARVFMIFAVATGLGAAGVHYQHVLVSYLTRLAYVDPLTALANRSRTAEYLEQEIRSGRAFYLVALKIHRFGQVAGFRGAKAADELIAALGARIKEALQPGDFAGRWTGTVFLVCREDTDAARLRDWATALLRSASSPIAVEDRETSLRAGIAVTRFPDDGLTLDRLSANITSTLETSDVLHGKVRFYNEASWSAEQRRFRLASALKGAVRRGELNLVYHPKIRLSDGACLGAEVLSRWRHPELGVVPPTEFIPVAESIGSIGEITAFVVEGFLADWPAIAAARGPACDDCRHALNLSPLDLADLDFPGYIASRCRAAGVPTSEIELEITEGMMMNDDGTTQAVLRELKAAGFRLAIDDFGTGYSSLSYLHKLEADNLKIDRSFIEKLGPEGLTGPIVDAIISMGRSLGMTITAEGVETDADAAYLEGKGCEFAQGWLYTEPIPLESYLAWLRRRG
ncbi:MAG: EAL domain-containing protein [Spirochaetales bacterium]|nr:EAL domain-containing protein [Spirochaetales bacterium]